MKKYLVTVPTIVSVSIIIEAENELDALNLSENMDFTLESSMNFGGGLSAVDKKMMLAAAEANYDGISAHEITDEEYE